jgi:small subunit ribosomal protein S17
VRESLRFWEKNNMETKHMQRMTGTVVSTKMQKTAVIKVTRLKKHPKYKKYIRISKRYKAHVEPGMVEDGDRVVIELTRPMSKDKRWRVVPKAKETV